MSSVKFKIGFTIPAETLFGLVAKFLPIEDLSVEEVVQRALPATPKASKIVALVARREPGRKRVNLRSMSLEAGVNKLILVVLADGKPHTATECKPSIQAAGYSPNGIGSRLNRLREKGVVFQPEIGLWQLAGTRDR